MSGRSPPFTVYLWCQSPCRATKHNKTEDTVVKIYDRMGVDERNLQVIDVDVILENCPITFVILNLLVYNSTIQCVFSSHSFWTSSSLDVPAGVTQEEGHTEFFIDLLSAVRA